jgi:hypothetical protein
VALAARGGEDDFAAGGNDHERFAVQTRRIHVVV